MKSLKLTCLAVGAAMLVANARAGTPGQMYLNLDAGGAWVQDVGTTSFDTGVRADAAFGYFATEALALEVEAGVVWSQEKTGSFDLYQIPLLVNAVYNVPVSGSWSAYVGGGVGGIWTQVEGSGSSSDDFVFGFQGLAGLKYQLSDKADIDLGYKFLGSLEHNFSGTPTEEIYTHAVLISFHWRF